MDQAESIMGEPSAAVIRSFAAAAWVLAWCAQPAIAQCDPAASKTAALSGPAVAPSIPAAAAPCYGRYYAPYAILAVAAYKPIQPVTNNPNEPGLDSKVGKPPLLIPFNNTSYVAGADVAYAVTKIDFDDPDTTKLARDLLRTWHYRFGHEGYLGCLDPKDEDCRKALAARWWTVYHSNTLAFQVWSNAPYHHNARARCSEVSIAFRGTDPTSASDWISNLHQVIGFATDDEYDQVGRNIGAIIRRISNLPCYVPSITQIVSVGHSLGGGLAQFAALAVPGNAPAQIAKVFAFDTSPVTAATAINAGVRTANANGLTIDRIHQEGEILSTYIGWDQQYPASSSACNPLVRTVSYDAFQPPPPTDRFGRLIHWAAPRAYNSLPLHSMSRLAAKLVEWSYDANGALINSDVPTISYPCATRYRNPSQPEVHIGPLVASLGAGRDYYASADYGGTPAPVRQAGRKLALAAGTAWDAAAASPAPAVSAKHPDGTFAPASQEGTLSASTASYAVGAQASQYGPIYPVMTDPNGPSAKPTRVQIHRVARLPAGHKARGTRTANY